VVCRYPKNELVLTGIFRTNQYEVAYDAFSYYVSKCRFADRYEFEDYSTIQSLNIQNEEGFVVKFSNGDRCKIKFADYVRLHKICTNLSTTAIWEWVSKGKDMSVLKDIPDEFYSLIKDYADSLKWLFNEKEKEAKEIFAAIKTPNRRKFAEQALTTGPLSRILFLMYDGKGYKETLWNMIKPEYRKL
jgi:RNA ligase